jgi:signal transduction histidine kinase
MSLLRDRVVDLAPDSDLQRLTRAARLASTVLLLCVGYYVGGILGTLLGFPPSGIAAIWPSTAILLAALLLAPARLWWAYLLAVIPTHLHLVANFQQPGVPPAVMLCQVAGNILHAVLGALAFRHVVGATPRFDSLRNMTAFILLAALGATAVASALAVSLFLFTGWATDFWLAWRQRVLANVFAIITIPPLIVLTVAGQVASAQRGRRQRYGELGFLTLGLLAVGIPVFGWYVPGPATSTALLFAPLPLLLWAAVRLGSGGLALSLLVVAGVSLVNAFLGRGPFVAQSPTQSVLSLQVFLLAISVPLMLLAALVAERDLAMHDLAERVKELTALHKTSRLLEENRLFDEGLLRELAALLPPAWQYPEVCEGRIRYAGLEATTAGWRETAWQQVESFTTSDGRTGALDVAYREERPAEAEGPFIAEERRLLQSLARMLTTHLDRQRAEQATRMLSGRLVTAQEEERRHIARELHDEIGQILTVVKINLESLREPGRFPVAVSGIEACVQNVDRAIQQVRALALDLRPAILDHLGLPAALRWFVDRIPTGKPTAHLAVEEGEREELSPEVKTAAFRIAQEAVTNVLRHARARNVWVSLAIGPANLELTVRDDGVGFDLDRLRRLAPGSSFGLSSMEERVRLVGGRIEIRTSPGEGTEVRAHFPVAAA